MRKLFAAFTILAILAGLIGNSANTANAAGCPEINGRGPTQRNAVKCHYDFPTSIQIRVHTSGPDQSVDLWDDFMGPQNGVTSGDYSTGSFTLNFGATVEVLGGSVTQAQLAPAQQAPAAQAPAPSQAQQPSTQGQLPPGWCFFPLADDQQFLPDGDAAYAALLLLGNASKAGLLSQPDATNFSGTWVLVDPAPETCLFIPWFAMVDYNVGQGDKTVVGPTFLKVANRATIKFNTEVGPRKGPPPSSTCFTPLADSEQFIPDAGDAAYAALLLLGNAGKANLLSQPDATNFSGTWTLVDPAPETCLFVPWYAMVDFDRGDGKGVQTVSGPTFLKVANRATIKFNTEVGPRKLKVRLLIPLLRKAA